MLPVEEQFNVHIAIGTAITQWAHLESSLAETFFISLKSRRRGAVLAAFFAVENFRSKLAMVDAAVKASVRTKKEFAAWKAISRRITKVATKRNHLAHYQILIELGNAAGSRVLVRPNIFDPFGAPRKGTFPEIGYRLVDMQNIQRDISAVRTTLENFNSRLSGRPELPDTFLESAAHKATYDNVVSHILKAHESQPQS